MRADITVKVLILVELTVLVDSLLCRVLLVVNGIIGTDVLGLSCHRIRLRLPLLPLGPDMGRRIRRIGSTLVLHVSGEGSVDVLATTARVRQ